MMTRHTPWILLIAVFMSACDGCEDVDPGGDLGGRDAGDVGGGSDLGAPSDVGMERDLWDPPRDAGPTDLSADTSADLGEDADAALDASDASNADMRASDQTPDMPLEDADMRLDMPDDMALDMPGDMPSQEMSGDMQDMTPPDMTPPTGSCVSGATGVWAARFRWEGNGPSSRAYVVYEENNLPDSSRWKASANARNIGYNPVYQDTFLGVGGLAMSSTVFMDLELSTVGMPAGTQATISILGRSYNTTSPGSFSWQTFAGTGQSPRGGVSNSAPYQWYSADATTELPVGNGSTLLRIKPEGPSGSLIVRSVEVCFGAP